VDPGAEVAHHRAAMESSDRILYVQILAQLLIVDGVLADQERSYLDRIMESLAMPEDERKRALKGVSVDSPVEERVQALGVEHRARLLAEVEKALDIDGQRTRSEEHFLARVKQLVG
jgi:uncharacterized tellurite resistance protein B-like protein